MKVFENDILNTQASAGTTHVINPGLDRHVHDDSLHQVADLLPSLVYNINYNRECQQSYKMAMIMKNFINGAHLIFSIRKIFLGNFKKNDFRNYIILDQLKWILPNLKDNNAESIVL